jgi:hypothetical protein
VALENTLKELRRATFIGKDFDTYVTELSQFIKQQFGERTFNDFVESDLGVMFLELVAFANSTLSFYLDLQSGESYLDTAKLRNSVVHLTRNIGFKMTGAVPATATVQISLRAPKSFDVPIGAGTQLTSEPGLFFETTADVIFKKIKDLTGTFILTKNSNIVKGIGDIIDVEITFGPNGEAETVVKLKSSLETAFRRVIATNVSVVPHQIILESPFPSDIFPDTVVFLQNDNLGAAGNVPIAETVANAGFVVSGMSGGTPTAPATGSITAIAGSLIADGETFTLADGINLPTVFEFDKNSSVTPGNVPVPITNAMTAAQVAQAILSAINGVGAGLQVTASFSVTSTPGDPLIAGDVGPKTVNVREGESVEELFLSTGKPNQFFRLQAVPAGKMIAEKSVKVFVNNVEFTEVNFLTFEERNIFEAQLASVPPLIRFGDGLSGNIPQENADVRVVYFATSGIKGNIPSGQINGFRFPVVVNFQAVSDVEVFQPNPATGGADFFPLSKAKALAPFVFKSLDRAVTEEDYTSLANTFVDPDAGAVGKARAIIIRSIDDDFILQNFLNQLSGIAPAALIQNIRNYWNTVVSGSCEVNVVQVGVLTVDADGRYRPPSAALLQKLTEFLDARKEATVDVLAFDGSAFIVPVDLSIQVKKKVGFTDAAVSVTVRDAVVDFLRSKNFGDSVRLGDLFQVVEGTDGVEFSRISFTFPVNPGSGIPIPGLEPAFFDQTDLVVGKLQIVEPRNIGIFFIG